MVRTCGENLPPAVLRRRSAEPHPPERRTHRPYGASLSGFTNRARHESAGAKGGPGNRTTPTERKDSVNYEDTRAAHRNRTHLRAFIPCICGQKQLAVPLTGSAPAIVHHLGSQPELLRFCLLLPDCAARPHPIDHLVMTITAGFGGWGLWCGDIGKGHRPESRLHHG